MSNILISRKTFGKFEIINLTKPNTYIHIMSFSDIFILIAIVFVITFIYSMIKESDKRAKQKNRYSRSYQNRQPNVLEMQVANHKRILNESCELVESSKNIDVIVRRKNTALEQLEWFSKNAHLGVSLNPPAEIGKENLLLNYNKSLMDQLEEQVKKQLTRIETLKTKNAQENALNKAKEIKNRFVPLFETSVSNYGEIENELKKISEQLESVAL